MADWSDLDDQRMKALVVTGEDRPGFGVVWPNVLWTAQLFWQARTAGDHDRRIETWHHLVMAVGNFKRQGGTQICLLRASAEDGIWSDHYARPDLCKVQTLTGEVELRRDAPDTWKLLTSDKECVKGVDVATATTLLSALWPGTHVIIDLRDLRASIGLNLAEAVTGRGVNTDNRRDVEVSWDWYEWMRTKIVSKAVELRTEPLTVERALYWLDRRVKRPRKGEPKQSWTEYAEALGGVLLELEPSS
jgi:hypothetical protein